MNYKDMIAIIIKVFWWLIGGAIKIAPCVILCITEIKKAKQDDGEVDPLEITHIIQKTGECIQKQFDVNALISLTGK